MIVYIGTEIESNINGENLNFIDKPFSFEKQVGFPYYDLQPRDFERLIYCLYKKQISDNNMENYEYDNIQLMQGVGERGRDCVLLKNGQAVGLIQCKRYKNNIDRSEVGKEILKFILHYTQDKNLVANLDCFVYIIAVSYGFSEKSLDLINSLTNNTYDPKEIEDWARSVIVKTEGLKLVSFDNIKDDLYDALNRVKFEKIIPDNLNLMIEKYAEIKSMFFDVKPVLDIKGFEKLIVEREREKIQLICNSSYLERTLEKKNPYLHSKLQETKKVVENLANNFSGNFILYSHHTKKHTTSSIDIISKKLLREEYRNKLNEIELYVLSMASYLHDIGICTENEIFKKAYNEYKESTKGYNFLSLEDYIREQHSYLTYNSIISNWRELKIEEEWKEAIALVAGENKNIDAFEYKYFEYSPDGGIEQVCIPYLRSLILLADVSDIENINSNYLLRNYREMEEFKFSKKLWDEVAFSISSRVSQNRLIFDGNCDKQLIYIALNNHIQEIKYTLEQLNSKIRKYDSKYDFSFHFVEEILETPFNKKVGFTIDYNGIAETLIGRNIYNNEFDAIREVIQNSIDSCNLKKKQFGEFIPKIEVELLEKDIVIKDNGIGMNYYIIENYFAKLCKSYYKDYNLDAIGQFGIGVFSYFMLCDSFTLETKTEKSNVIKFEAYRNLRSYFYFYDNISSRTEPGTTISLHIKEEVVKKLEFEVLVAEIEKYFKFIDIPIIVKCKEREKIIKKQDFTLNAITHLNSRLRYSERDEINKFKFLEVYINNENFEGICGVIVEKTELFEYTPIYIDAKLKYYPRHENLLICQNGVAVNDFDSFGFGFIEWSSLVGKINIKRKLKINLSRNKFSDSSITNIIVEFQVELFKKFINLTKSFEPKIAYYLYSKFINSYSASNSLYDDHGLGDFMLDNVQIIIFRGSKIEYNVFSKIIQENEKFIFFSNVVIDDREFKLILEKFQIPIVIVENKSLGNLYFELFRKANYEFNLIDDYGKCIFIVNVNNKTQRKSDINYKLAIDFNDDLLFNKVTNDITVYNTSHPLIQLILNNSEQLGKGNINEFFSLIDSPCSRTVGRELSLKEVNSYLNEEVLKKLGIEINITVKDFPERYRINILD